MQINYFKYFPSTTFLLKNLRLKNYQTYNYYKNFHFMMNECCKKLEYI